MSEPIRLTIRAQNAETDSPTVEDLLAQIGDWNSILRGVEEAIAEDGASEIEWRVTGARKDSPLLFELTPFPRRHGMNIERRTKQVTEEYPRVYRCCAPTRNGQVISQIRCWKRRKGSLIGSIMG